MAKPDLRGRLRKSSPAAVGGFGPASPSGQAPPGIVGQLPLPTGQVITVDHPTQAELTALRAIKPDFQPGDAVPSDFASQVQAAQDAIAYDLANPPLPGSPSLPPLQMPTELNISQLPPERQQQLREALDHARLVRMAQEEAAADAMPGAAPGVNEAIQASRQPPVSDDRQSDSYSAGAPKPQPESPTGARLVPRYCPHCNWELQQACPAPPTSEERQAFLAAILGNRPYASRWELLGGNLIMAARQLTPKEVDMCWSQAYLDDKKQPPDANVTMDALRNEFMERVMRYRTALQLMYLSSPGGFTYDLPESTAQWKDSLGWPDSPPGAEEDTLVKHAADYVYETVFASENVLRIVMQQLGLFNRQAVQLEANMANSGFWEATPAGR